MFKYSQQIFNKPIKITNNMFSRTYTSENNKSTYNNQINSNNTLKNNVPNDNSYESNNFNNVPNDNVPNDNLNKSITQDIFFSQPIDFCYYDTGINDFSI